MNLWRKMIASLRTLLTGDPAQAEYAIVYFNTTSDGVAGQLFADQSDLAAERPPLVTFTSYDVGEGEFVCSLLYHDAGLTSQALPLQDVICGFLAREFGQQVTTCQSTIARTKPLTESSALGSGELWIEVDFDTQTLQRYRLLWRADEHLEKDSPEYNLPVAVMDVVVSGQPVGSNGGSQPQVFVNLAVLHRCEALPGDPVPATWEFVQRQLRLPANCALGAMEAMGLPTIGFSTD